MNTPEPSPTGSTEPLTQVSRRPVGSTQRIIAGVLTVISGMIALVNGFTALSNETVFHWPDVNIALNEFSVCGVIVIIFGAVAIVGGLSAIKGGKISLALAGAAMGVMGGGIWGFALGLTAIVLLFLSEGDL